MMHNVVFEASSEGMYQGRAAKVFNIMGRRSAFVNTTDLHDVAEYLGDTATVKHTDLAGTEALELVSSSASDAAAGTGLRTLNVAYIDSSGYLQLSAPITVNGVTPVALGFTAKCILWMQALSNGSGGVAAGNVDVRVVSGAAVQERITAGGNRSLSARFMVPVGYEAFIPSWEAHSVNQDMDARLRATVCGFARTLITPYIFQDNAYMALNTNHSSDLPYLMYPAGTRIKVSVKPGATTGSPRCDASFPIILIAG